MDTDFKKFHAFCLKEHNSFGINAYATTFITYNSIQELKNALKDTLVYSPEKPILNLGGGNNIIFSHNFDGVILKSNIIAIEIHDETQDYVCVKVGSGVPWDSFVVMCIERKWYGAENLSFIPGEVGGCIVQNIGAYGSEVKDIVESVYCIDAKTMEEFKMSNQECEFGYRDSIFKSHEFQNVIITAVDFKLSKTKKFNVNYPSLRQELIRRADTNSCNKAFIEYLINEKNTIANIREAIGDLRERKLPNPKKIGNSGSFFTNPIITREQYNSLIEYYPEMPYYPTNDSNEVKVPAAWLIEQCGWKGKALGRVACYEKQPLVLINLGGATGDEVIKLANTIRNSVEDKFNILLTPEVIIL